jgi:hypothetical protein
MSKYVDRFGNLYKQQVSITKLSLDDIKKKQDELRQSYENGDITLTAFREQSI